MPRLSPGRRAGFTLIELLVAMAVIVTLAAITVAVVPGAMEQDRTTDAAATVRQHLMIAKARATREREGRGIRFILDRATDDPVKLAAGTAGRFLSSEMQYIEAAPTVVPNPLGVSKLDFSTTPPTEREPCVDLTNGTTATIRNLPATHEAILVIENDLGANWFPNLYCPELGKDAFGRTQRFEILKLVSAGGNNWTVTLAQPSDPPPALTLLGTGDQLRSYRFAIEPRSRPLLGEPNVNLPKNVCVDLNPFVSSPSARVVGGNPTDFEIMFQPNGQVSDPVSSGMIYLWVRDYTKVPNVLPLTPNAGAPTAAYTYAAGPPQFRQGGEQQLVAIKAKSGALGVFPVMWPQDDGTYGAGLNPYFLASKDSTSP